MCGESPSKFNNSPYSPNTAKRNSPLPLQIWLALFFAVSTRIGYSDEEFTEPDAEDFAYPVSWLKTAPVKDRMKYEFHRNRLLKFGWEGSPAAAIVASREEFEAARQFCKDDPRLEYAMGLVMWKYDRRPEAIKLFAAASRMNGNQLPFLPAAQATAWAMIVDNQRDAGLKQIVQVARVLNSSQGNYPTSVQKQDSALFLGRAIGFLRGPGRSKENADAELAMCDQAAGLITSELSSEFELGQRQIDKRHAELKALAERPAEEIVAEYNRKQNEFKQRTAQIKSDLEQVKTGMNTRGKEQRESLVQFQSQIAQGERALSQIQNSLNAVTREVNYYSRPQKHYQTIKKSVKYKDEDTGRTRYRTETETVERPESSLERSARLAQLAAARSRQGELEARGSRTLLELKQLQSDRRTSIKTFQSTQDDWRRERSGLVRAQRELAAQMKQLDLDYESPEVLKSRVNTISPYVPWDPDVEREALLFSYRIPLPETSTP